MKLLIFTLLTIGGLLGAWIGSKMDGGFGLWSFLFGFVLGPVLGIWIGYKIGKAYLE
jgi:hypothetical protein